MKVAGDRATLAALPAWWLDGEERRVEHTKMHSAWLLAKLAGIETREQALALKGKAIAVPRAALPEPADGIYYWADLVGLEVVNREGVALGCVTDVTGYGAHPVLQVSAAGAAVRLIPYVPAYVERVDLERRRIDVDWQPDY